MDLQSPQDEGLLFLLRFFGSVQCAFVTEENVFNLEREFFTFVNLSFVNPLKFAGELPDGFVCVVKFALKMCHVLLQFADIALEEESLPEKFKQLLEHGE